MKVLINVIKNIFCVEEYRENCNKCSLCHLIDLNNLPSLKIIEPDGNFIKKEQILELKHFFSKQSQYTKENIYIIKHCEKLNKDSANTMLKFLEEPEGSVIGFFITSHEDNVLPTIQSRCQHISTNFDNTDSENYDITEEEYNTYLKEALDYLKEIDEEQKENIIYNKKYLKEYKKEEVKLILQLMLQIYKEEIESRYLNINLKTKVVYLKKYSVSNLLKKTNLIIELLKEINYNVNLELLLDRFVLQMEVINHESV